MAETHRRQDAKKASDEPKETKASKVEKLAEKPDDATLLRMLAFNAGIVDHKGRLMPKYERMLSPVEGTAYTASSVLKTAGPSEEDEEVTAEIERLQAEAALVTLEATGDPSGVRVLHQNNPAEPS